ncbi:MAG: hypothetical protein ACLPID_10750 [Beijerinckiaceae bacterium]
MNGSVSILLFVILALNFGISWWNAYACGRAWVESKAVGGVVRVLVWCGAIQSAIGFSSVFLFPMIFAAHAFFPDYFTDDFLNGAVSLWYVTIIFPALGSGLIITIESWNAAYREHSLANLGVAAYNTFAQIHNTMRAIESFGPAWESIVKMFASVATSRGDAKGKVALLGLMGAIAIAAIALCAGAVLTAVLIHRYAGTVPLPAQSPAKTSATPDVAAR